MQTSPGGGVCGGGEALWKNPVVLGSTPLGHVGPGGSPLPAPPPPASGGTVRLCVSLRLADPTGMLPFSLGVWKMFALSSVVKLTYSSTAGFLGNHKV